MIGLVERQHPSIAENIIDGVQPGRSEVRNPAHLHRRRFPRENRQPVAVGMARQIDEHMNAVIANRSGSRFVIEIHDAAPCRETRFDPRAQRIFMGPRGIRIELHTLRVQMRHDVLDEESDRMDAQISRNEANAHGAPYVASARQSV